MTSGPVSGLEPAVRPADRAARQRSPLLSHAVRLEAQHSSATDGRLSAQVESTLRLQALMRLSPDQSRAIVRAVRDLAGEDANVRLFGSRTRDELRGGDIDLLVECARPVAQPVWLAARITARLQRALGERKIDVLVVDPDTAIEPVHAVARAEGSLLDG